MREEGKEREGVRLAKRPVHCLQEGCQKDLVRRGRPKVLWGSGTRFCGVRGWSVGKRRGFEGPS